MTSATAMSLLSLLVLAALGSSRDLESCTVQGESSETPSVGLLQITRANEDVAFQKHEGGGTSIAAENRKIYTYWDYGSNPRPIVALNVQTWLKHAPPDTELVLVNESNFRSLIPDAPEEVFQLPYAASKSDVVRAAVLYHHGGLYLDTDFVVMKPLSSIFAKLEEGWDVVAYGDSPFHASGECNQNKFTSNFMAARKGNAVSGTWWENIKAKLTRTCDVGDFAEEKVCCHEAFTERHECHIPWGHLEWLKNPMEDADSSSWRSPPNERSKSMADSVGPDANAVLAAIEHGNAKPKKLPQDARIFCFQGEESFAPLWTGDIYWQKWDAKARATSADAAKDSTGQYSLQFQCQDIGNNNLNCNQGITDMGPPSVGVIPNFFGRMAYHLFFSLMAHDKPTREETLKSDWLAAELIRRSLGESL